MGIHAGKLDRRITIQRATKEQDETGKEAQIWADLTTVWASKEDVSDGERVAAEEVASQITTRFQIRWSTTVAGVNPKDRVVYNGKTYDLSAVKEIGRHEGLELSGSARSDG